MVENAGWAESARLGITVGQAATRAGLSIREIQRAIQSGALPAHETSGGAGRQYVVRPSDLDSYIVNVVKGTGGASTPASRTGLRPSKRAWWRTRARLSPLAIAALCAVLAMLLLGGAIFFGPAPAPRSTHRPTIAPGRSATPTATPSRSATPTATPSHTTNPTATPSHTATPSRSGAAPVCRSGAVCRRRSGHGATSAPSSATTSTRFTIELRRRQDGATIVISGEILLREGLVPQIKALYLGCGRTAGQEPGAAPGVGAPTTTIQTSIHVAAPLSLPAAAVARLQRWAARYGTLIGADDPHITDVIDGDPDENSENDGGTLWRDLRTALGPEYVLGTLQTQHDNTLRVQPQDRCPAAPRGVSGGAPPTATPRAGGTIPHLWRGPSFACANAESALAARLREMLQGTIAATTLHATVARQQQACAAWVVAAPPRAMATDRAVWQAYRASAAAARAVRGISNQLQDIMTGNTNKHAIVQAAGALDRAASTYTTYARIVLAHLRGSAAPRVHS